MPKKHIILDYLSCATNILRRMSARNITCLLDFGLRHTHKNNWNKHKENTRSDLNLFMKGMWSPGNLRAEASYVVHMDWSKHDAPWNPILGRNVTNHTCLQSLVNTCCNLQAQTLKYKHSSKAGIGYLVVSRIGPLNALSIIRQVSWYHRESLTNHAPAHQHVVCRSRRHQWSQTSRRSGGCKVARFEISKKSMSIPTPDTPPNKWVCVKIGYFQIHWLIILFRIKKPFRPI
jgi:hypothetical protein